MAKFKVNDVYIEMAKYRVNDVVQFNENHKWIGCLGIIAEVKDCGDDYRYMIGVPIPERGTAYIFSMEKNAEFEYIGRAVLGEPEEDSGY